MGTGLFLSTKPSSLGRQSGNTNIACQTATFLLIKRKWTARPKLWSWASPTSEALRIQWCSTIRSTNRSSVSSSIDFDRPPLPIKSVCSWTIWVSTGQMTRSSWWTSSISRSFSTFRTNQTTIQSSRFSQFSRTPSNGKSCSRSWKRSLKVMKKW